MADQHISGNGAPSGNGRNGDFRFADFEVHAAAHELRKGGIKVHLEVQPFQVLLALLERKGEVVTRKELKQALWPDDTFVDFDNGVNQAVSKIRRVLSDSATRPRFVETIPRVGYRFVGRMDSSTEHQATREAPSPSRGQWVRYAGVGLAASLATLLVHQFFNVGPASSPPQVPPRRWTYEVGDLQTTAPRLPLLAISPDGRYVAYVAGASRRLWVQDLNRATPTALRGTDGAGRFDWSQDSKTIVFAVEGAIRSVAVPGGAPTTLWQDSSVNPAREVLWDAAGEMVRFLHRGGTLYELPARGGQPRESSLDREAFLWGPRFAVIAPHLLFVEGFYGFERQIMWRGPSATEPRPVATGWTPSYSSGHIVFESFFSSKRSLGDPLLDGRRGSGRAVSLGRSLAGLFPKRID